MRRFVTASGISGGSGDARPPSDKETQRQRSRRCPADLRPVVEVIDVTFAGTRGRAHIRGRIITIGLAALLAVAGCNNSSATPTANPQVAFCSSIASLGSAIATFKSMDAQDTISDIQTSAAAVKSAFQAFKDAAGGLATSQVATIETAATGLQSAVAAIPSSDTVDQALASLAPQVAPLDAARFEAGKAQCGEVKRSATPAPTTAPAPTLAPAAS